MGPSLFCSLPLHTEERGYHHVVHLNLPADGYLTVMSAMFAFGT